LHISGPKNCIFLPVLGGLDGTNIYGSFLGPLGPVL
jgi:hypothetical protein